MDHRRGRPCSQQLQTRSRESEMDKIVKPLSDDEIMEIIKEVAPWKEEPKLNDLLTHEKSVPLFPQATYDVPSYRAEKFVRAVEKRILSAIDTQAVEERIKRLENILDNLSKAYVSVCDMAGVDFYDQPCSWYSHARAALKGEA